MERFRSAYAAGFDARPRASHVLPYVALALTCLVIGCGGGTTTTTTAVQSTVPPPSSPPPSPPPSSPPPPPPLDPLPDWVNQLAVGQWYSLPDTAMSSVAPTPTPAGITGPASKVIAWTSFVVDPRSSKIYSVANGGHADYSGNEVDVLDLERQPPAWRQLLPPTPNSQLTDCLSYYADGAPTSRHSYYGATLNSIEDRIMLFGGGMWCRAGGFHTAISSYNIRTNAWSPLSEHGSIPRNLAGGVAAYALDPSTGDVYGSFNFNFGRWTRSSNAFTTLSPGGNRPPGDRALSAFDTTRGRILFLGENVNRHLFTLASNTWTRIDVNGGDPADVAAVSGASQGAMAYVPALDSYLVRRHEGGGTVYQINAANFHVTKFATTGGASIPSTHNGPFNKFLYVPRLRGFVYVPSYAQDVWFLRIH